MITPDKERWGRSEWGRCIVIRYFGYIKTNTVTSDWYRASVNMHRHMPINANMYAGNYSRPKYTWTGHTNADMYLGSDMCTTWKGMLERSYSQCLVT